MKTPINAIIFALAIVIASFFLGNAYTERSKSESQISVTGLGKKDFSSDLIVWEGSFGSESMELSAAFEQLQKDKELIRAYLIEKGVGEDKIVFEAVRSTKKQKRLYAPDGDYMGERFDGYSLTQSLKIESNEVEKIERIAREITELLNKGVQFYSRPPRYYYTGLADLKIEMISKATEDARVRAEKIAENSGAQLGDLKSARMGVFQITGQNSTENYSWGGTFNTADKEKTASITMKLIFEVD